MDRILLPAECSPDAFLDKVTPKKKRKLDKEKAAAAQAAAARAPPPRTPTPPPSELSSVSTGSSANSACSGTSLCSFVVPRKRQRPDSSITVPVVVVSSRREE